MGKINNPIDERVIDFTSAYTGVPAQDINDSTTLKSIGIISEEDVVQYVMELEESFGLIYEEGDANGIVTVGDATKLIESKLGRS